jgi:hypothetical protein
MQTSEFGLGNSGEDEAVMNGKSVESASELLKRR